MTDLNKERELELFNAFVEKNLPELFEKHSNSNFFAKIIYDSMLGAWLGAKTQAVPEGYVLISEEAVEKKDRRIEELEYSLKAIYHRAESTYCSACRFAEAEAADVGCGAKTSESGVEQ